MNIFFTYSQSRIIAVVKYQVPVGLPAGEKKYLFSTHLDSGQIRVQPTGKKLSPYLYPLGRVPDRYRVLVPELPSLVSRSKSSFLSAPSAPTA
jgi:hypothetical protein